VCQVTCCQVSICLSKRKILLRFSHTSPAPAMIVNAQIIALIILRSQSLGLYVLVGFVRSNFDAQSLWHESPPSVDRAYVIYRDRCPLFASLAI
jgi:hypothetical protein